MEPARCTRTAQGDGGGVVEDGVGVRELARCTRTAQGDGGGGVEDGVGVRGEDYCWQHSMSYNS